MEEWTWSISDWGNPKVIMGISLALTLISFLSLPFTLGKTKSRIHGLLKSFIWNFFLLTLLGAVYSFENVRLNLSQSLWAIGSVVIFFIAGIGSDFVAESYKGTVRAWLSPVLVVICLASFIVVLSIGFSNGQESPLNKADSKQTVVPFSL